MNCRFILLWAEMYGKKIVGLNVKANPVSLLLFILCFDTVFISYETCCENVLMFKHFPSTDKPRGNSGNGFKLI